MKSTSSENAQSVLFIVAAVILAGLAVYFLASGAPKTAIILSVFSFASFATSLLQAPRFPHLEMDHEGLYDPRLGIGKIYWNEVRDFYVADGEGNRFICLDVERPERFLIQADRSQRARMSLHHSIGFRRINVDVRHLNVSVQDLHRRIETRLQRAHGLQA